MEGYSEDNFFKEVSAKDKGTWKRICQLWEGSGESAKEFCVKRGLKKNTLNYWRSKFIKEEQTRDSKLISSFLPLKLKESVTTESSLSVGSSSLSLKIRTPQGYEITIPLQGDMGLIGKIFQVLGIIHA